LLKFLRSVNGNFFYRERFDASIISDLKNGDPLSAIRKLPILSKQEVRTCRSKIADSSSQKVQKIFTSGTTGSSLEFISTRSAVRYQWAVWWRYRMRYGIQFNELSGHFGGKSVVPVSSKKPPFFRYNYPASQLYFSAYHMNELFLAYYVDALNRYKPKWLHGFPSSLAILSEYIVTTGKYLIYPVEWITTGAESLLEQHIDIIKRAFGKAPIQHYGMAEAVANISQHPDGNLYVDEDFSFVEFVPSSVEGFYRVIGTNFLNSAFPLLRYDTGDIVTGENLSCMTSIRKVNTIDGRREDFVVLRNGVKVGRLDHIFKRLHGIREAQICQREPGRITMKVVRGSSFTADDEVALLNETAKRLGQETDVQILYVDEIQRLPSGKFRFVVSEIS
jgi:phenylacetate-CoA ligase